MVFIPYDLYFLYSLSFYCPFPSPYRFFFPLSVSDYNNFSILWLNVNEYLVTIIRMTSFVYGILSNSIHETKKIMNLFIGIAVL